MRRGSGAVRRARRGNGAVRWSPPGCGRRGHRPQPDAIDPRHRPRQPPGHGAAGGHQSRRQQGGAAARLLLRTRSVVAAGLHDRRQRRRELRRSALPEIRLHHAPRPRGNVRHRGRADHSARRDGSRRRRLRPPRRGDRQRGDARHRDRGRAPHRPSPGVHRDRPGSLRHHGRRRRGGVADHRRRHHPRGHRDDGPPRDPGMRGHRPCGLPGLRRSPDRRARRSRRRVRPHSSAMSSTSAR